MKTAEALPKTDSIQELAEFWDTHDLTDFEDELEEVTQSVFAPRTAIRLDLESGEAEAVRKIAEAKGVPDKKLIHSWVREKMTKGKEFEPAEEYNSLREELLQAKKYVFERPILIVAAAAAGSRGLEKEFLILVLVLVAALLLFNFWFTVNRLFSAARIAAYIQLELEERSHGRWVGWETCLREYRRWLQVEPIKRRQEIDESLDIDAIPDALMYYSPIYKLHIGLMAMAVCITSILAVHNWTWLSGAGALLVILLASWFVRYLNRYRPKTMRASIERNRAIWKLVFTAMQSKGLK